jgi:hypothetical protein
VAHEGTKRSKDTKNVAVFVRFDLFVDFVLSGQMI